MDSRKERLHIIDALRGIALLGVLLSHVTYSFSGWVLFMTKEQMAALPTAPFDKVIFYFLVFFVVHKARALFAFVFGCAFFFQLYKAVQQGESILKRFTKRMFLLTVIGLLHAFLFFGGEVLKIYGVCGMALLLFYKLRPRLLLVYGFFFTVLIPSIGDVLKVYFPFQDIAHVDLQKAGILLASTNYTDTIRANLEIVKEVIHPYFLTGFILPILGCFLLGYWAMKTNLLKRLTENKQMLRRSFTFCLTVILIQGLLFIGLFIYREGNSSPSSNVSQILLPALRPFFTVVMAYGYLCLIVWLMEKERAKYVIASLIPLGQMSLTNYVMQSVFALLVFYGPGLGLIGKYGPTITIPIAIPFFALQMVYSRWWLQRFTSGPLEYLWRSALAGRWQQWHRQQGNRKRAPKLREHQS